MYSKLSWPQKLHHLREPSGLADRNLHSYGVTELRRVMMISYQNFMYENMLRLPS